MTLFDKLAKKIARNIVQIKFDKQLLDVCYCKDGLMEELEKLEINVLADCQGYLLPSEYVGYPLIFTDGKNWKFINFLDLPNFKDIEIKGYFDCSFNELITLKGAPEKVGGDFKCYFNKLKTLEGAPKKVGGDFDCSGNHLITLEGAPKEVGGDFACSGNELTTLEGVPKEVGKSFYCSGNHLITLEGAPKEVGGDFDCSFNLVKLNYKQYLKDLHNKKNKDFDEGSKKLGNLRKNSENTKDNLDITKKLSEKQND